MKKHHFNLIDSTLAVQNGDCGQSSIKRKSLLKYFFFFKGQSVSFYISVTRSALTVRRQIVDVVAIKTVVMIILLYSSWKNLKGKKQDN